MTDSTKIDFFIVGAPKCSTTAFNSYLDAHPKINMVEKEQHVWGSDLKFQKTESNKKELYLKDIQGKYNSDKLIGEGAVWYLVSKNAAEELKTFSPESKILIFLRNPVDAIYSLYSNMNYNGNDFSESFEKALENQKLRLTELPKLYNCPSIAFQYQKVYSYYDQVKRYIDVFGKDQVKVIIFEEFITDKQKVYNDILKFIKVEDYKIEFEKINANREVRFQSIKSLIFKPNKIKQGGKILIPSKPLREKLKWSFLRLNTKHTERAEMKPETKKMLQEYFKSDIEKLERLLEKDLSLWK